MRISVATGIKIINDCEWDSCRYTKGEGFCLDENAQGISLEYSAVFVDDIDAFVSQGGTLLEEMKVVRVPHPELTYLLDVDSVKDDAIPLISAVSLTPSMTEINRYLVQHPFIKAEACLAIDESFTIVESSVEIEAFKVSSDI